MRSLKIVLALAVTAAIVSYSRPGRVAACSCATFPPDENHIRGYLDNSTAVVLARINSVTKSRSENQYTPTVERSYKGPPAGASIRLHSSPSAGSCGYEIDRTGTRHLLDVYETGQVDLCGSFPLDEAGTDMMAFL